MSADYAVLAPIYDSIGMSEFAQEMTPRLVNFVQRTDWMGRRVLDLGCGTGAGSVWFSQHGYFVTGVDSAPQMLDIARARFAQDERHADYTLVERDARTLGNDLGAFDLVLALDMLNEFSNLRDLETVFRDVCALLNPGKLFIFDMHTIQGLTVRGTGGDQIVYNDGDLSVFCRNSYDYERQIHERQHFIFNRRGDLWLRSEAERVLRAFPVQAVATLLQRCGFGASRVFNLNFEPFDPGTSQAERIIFIAEKR